MGWQHGILEKHNSLEEWVKSLFGTKRRVVAPVEVAVLVVVVVEVVVLVAVVVLVVVEVVAPVEVVVRVVVAAPKQGLDRV